MLNFVKKRYGILLSLFLILLFILYLVFDSSKLRLYPKTLSFDTLYININLYEKSPQKARKALQKIEEIYQKYEKIATGKQALTLSYIQNNKEKEMEIEIDETLYEILSYAQKFYSKTEKYSILEEPKTLWEQALKQNKEPSLEALEALPTMEKMHLGKNYKIENNHLSLDIRFLALAFANQEIEAYFQEKDISSYLINASGLMMVGKRYQKEKYKVGLQDSDQTYYQTLELENTFLSTTGESIEHFTYQNQKYPKKVDPQTHKISDTYKNVTVVGGDPILNQVLSETLFFLSEEEGKKLVQDFKAVQVIIQTRENKVISYTS